MYLISDFLCPAFVCALDPLVVLCMGKVLTVHAYLPVYIREIKAGLYGPTAYFFANVIIHGISCIFYPMVLVGIPFWMWDYTDDSFLNFVMYFCPVLLLAEMSTLLGLMMGALIRDDT